MPVTRLAVGGTGIRLSDKGLDPVLESERAPCGALSTDPQSADVRWTAYWAGVSSAACRASSAAAFIDRRTRPFSSASSTLTRITWPSFR